MDINQIVNFLQQVHLINLTMYDGSFLGKCIETRMKQMNCCTLEDYYAILRQDYTEGKNLEDSVQIHYSEFFRDPLTFALLERVILPEIIQKSKVNARKEIRIWSAGCAAGQEAYSIAILLEEWNAGSLDKRVNYRIFATDLDEKLLREAQMGIFPAAALKNSSLNRVQTWFSKNNETYRIKSEVQQNIDFSIFNLLEDQRSCPPPSIFGDFDVVFCCNVLFYYQPEFQQSILEKLGNCISNEGYLITGETERNIVLNHQYYEVYPQAAIFRAFPARKNSI